MEEFKTNFIVEIALHSIFFTVAPTNDYTGIIIWYDEISTHFGYKIIAKILGLAKQTVYNFNYLLKKNQNDTELIEKTMVFKKAKALMEYIKKLPASDFSLKYKR